MSIGEDDWPLKSSAPTSVRAFRDRSFRYVIVAPPFDENRGGSIALHYLCHLLNQAGADASVTPMLEDWTRRKTPWVRLQSLARTIKNSLLTKNLQEFAVSPSLVTPLNHRALDRRTIVVYPEVVSGNPLNAPNVVRWFLHKPGHIKGRTEYGNRELYFFFQKAFDEPMINKDPNNLLAVRWYRTDVYHEWNTGGREGTCYLLRKGRLRDNSVDLSELTLLDGCSHEEMAIAFNKHEYFVSFDPYTMYSRYAALCGCISIVVPTDGVAKSDWRPEPDLAYGIAYGHDDIDWAVRTRPHLVEAIEREESAQVEQVSRFIEKTCSFFGTDS